ncbi:MAG: amidohydrolase [Alistipes sp.]|nr:amidohydrolase [Alistipes sp.]
MNAIDFRRHLHRHPELSFEEHETAAFIREQLTAAGIACQAIATTGILARIEGRHSTSETARRAIVLRADIDALPIEEQSGLAYASCHQGVMHACGHDMHAAMLYGALLQLAENPDFEGTVFGLFQPGEECNPGGASLVLAEEPFAGYDIAAVIGQHVDWRLEVGTIGVKAGAFMAASDELRFRVHGKGGHGAMRHLLKDPVAASAELISRLLSLNNPNQTLSLGRVVAEGATNVVPDEVYLEGTLRTFNEEERQQTHATITAYAQAIDHTHGTTTEIDINHGYPCVTNEASLVTLLQAVAAAQGVSVEPMERLMTAEDFGFYTRHYPSLFYRLGVGAASGRSHTAQYAPSEEAIGVGIDLLCALTVKLMNR